MASGKSGQSAVPCFLFLVSLFLVEKLLFAPFSFLQLFAFYLLGTRNSQCAGGCGQVVGKRNGLGFFL
jgi:hypothetical protein